MKKMDDDWGYPHDLGNLMKPPYIVFKKKHNQQPGGLNSAQSLATFGLGSSQSWKLGLSIMVRALQLIYQQFGQHQHPPWPFLVPSIKNQKHTMTLLRLMLATQHSVTNALSIHTFCTWGAPLWTQGQIKRWLKCRSLDMCGVDMTHLSFYASMQQWNTVSFHESVSMIFNMTHNYKTNFSWRE